MQPARELPARLVHVSLAAILALAVALRITGVGWMLPQSPEPDSIVFREQVEHLRSDDPRREPDPVAGYYPLLFARLAALAPAPAEPLPPSADLARHLDRAATEHRRLRLVVAWLSVLIVPATFLLARGFLPAGASLLAAAFMAASTLHLWFAQQARPHAASAAFGLVAVVSALNLRRRGRPVDYAFAGIALGLAVGSLVSGLLTLVPLAVALLLRERPARRESLLWVLLPLGILFACVLAFYPTWLGAGGDGGAAGIVVEGGVLRLFGHLIFLDQFRGAGFGKVFAAFRDYEPWIALLAVAGGLLALLRGAGQRSRDLAVILSHALPYAIAIGLYARTYQRFAIPLVPYAACLAAYAVARLARPFPRPLAAALVALLLAPQAWLALRLNAIRRAGDTISEAAGWVGSNLPPGEARILVMPTFDLPLPRTQAALEESARISDTPSRPWFRHERALAPDARPSPAWNLVTMPVAGDGMAAIQADPVLYLRGLRGEWAVIEVYGEGRRPPVLGAIRAGLERIGERVARFAPDRADEGEDLPLVGQDDELPRTSAWAWRAARARCVGPVVEVWRIR